MGIQCGLRAISKLMQMLPKWNLKGSKRKSVLAALKGTINHIMICLNIY